MLDFFATSQSGAQGHLKAVNRRRDKFEKKWAPVISKALQAQINTIIRSLRKGKRFNVPNKPLFDVLDAMLHDIAGAFISLALRDIEKELKSHSAEHIAAQRAADAYIKDVIPTRLNQINAATKRTVQGIIQSATEANPDLTASALRSVIVGDVTEWWAANDVARTGLIATTETTLGSEAGIDAAMNTIERPVLKIWQTSFQNSRDTHIAASGQSQKMEDPFTVGGGQLMFPGDGSLDAPVGESINCHCARTFEIQ